MAQMAHSLALLSPAAVIYSFSSIVLLFLIAIYHFAELVRFNTLDTSEWDFDRLKLEFQNTKDQIVRQMVFRIPAQVPDEVEFSILFITHHLSWD